MIFICGLICSGKSYYGKLLAQGLKIDFVEVSSIVKQITQKETRKELQGRPELDSLIIEVLTELKNHSSDMVVSGVRQVSILEAFPDATCIWVDAPRKVRLEKYFKRADIVKDLLTEKDFEEAEQSDYLLGIDKIREYILD